MYQEILTLFSLLCAIFIIYQQGRNKKIPNGKLTSKNHGFSHEYSDEISKVIYDRVFHDYNHIVIAEIFEEFQFKFSQRQTFIFTPPKGTAEKFARKNFSFEEAEEIINELNKYKSATSEDTELMQVHILKASDGNTEQVRSLVAKAKKDFRDVLNQAHSPNCINVVLKHKGRLDLKGHEFMAASDLDLRQYVEWIAKCAGYSLKG